MPDWLRVEYGIEKPSNKLLPLTDLDSNTWVSEVKRIRGKKQPLSSAGLHALRVEYTRTIEPTRALAAETMKLERTLGGLEPVSVLPNDTYATCCSSWSSNPSISASFRNLRSRNSRARPSH